ncbi:MAG TPA: hypothetical protein PLV75_12980, partial [Saprospiraceae bacterium]|nr:hypothetical protein [Saprospiraceae bacterium]
MRDCLLRVLMTGLFLGFISLTIGAQTTLTGRVSDETHQPVPFANVLLLSSSDSSLVKGGVAGDDGGFTLSTLDGG